ncbi:MAG: hypothetical protein KKF62_17625 [Bacteroidetes bacterium]|nr:hypothetical protein [Bacteroidota bacterium]MBU1114445.1 hypothetical protein [Bacteroidota bacterium]MBU1799793.1 hypothetical protein [Bacteroidota bacterium]
MVNENQNNMNYGKYIIAWVVLILSVILQVVISGISLGSNSQFYILLLASISAFVIIAVYMTDKSNKLISNFFKGIILLELLFVIFYDFIN